MDVVIRYVTLPHQNTISAENFRINDGVPESRHQGALIGVSGLSRFIIFTRPYSPARFGSTRPQSLNARFDTVVLDSFLTAFHLARGEKC